MSALHDDRRIIDFEDGLSIEAMEQLLAEKRRLESRIKNFIDPQLKKGWQIHGSFEGSGYYVRRQQTRDFTYKESILAEAILQNLVDPNHALKEEGNAEFARFRAAMLEALTITLGSMTESQLKGIFNKREDRECLFYHKEAMEKYMETHDDRDHGMREYFGKPETVIRATPPDGQIVIEPGEEKK